MSEPSNELRDFVGQVELEDLSFAELTARRALEPVESEGNTVEPRYTLNAQMTDDHLHFRLTLRIDLEASAGELRAAAMADYRVEEKAASALTMRMAVEYANEVGVMALLPYLRQAIADLSLRVFGTALLMPIQQRGAVSFALPD